MIAYILVLLVCFGANAQAITSNASEITQLRSLRADSPFPPYERGKGKYQFILTELERMNGMSYLGAKSRLRVAVNKLKKGEPFKAGYVGGSITGGQGAVDAPNWPQYVSNWLEDHFGGKSKATGQNGAVGGTLSSYMSVCHNLHIPKDADIVFVEYSVNDWHSPGGPPFQNNIRRAFERLLRKILRYPNKPAVVLFNAYIWFQAYPFPGSFWSNSEREFSEFALFYHLPSISLKSAVYHKMASGQPGFLITDTRNKNPDGLKEKAFYWDPIHPDGRTGARVMAELAIHLIDSTLKEIESFPVKTEELNAAYQEGTQPPMIPGNWESASDKCFIGKQFTESVTQKDGFEWINESTTERPKWGYVSKVVGSILKMKIDTRASSKSGSTGGGSSAGGGDEVLVELAYLKSYEGMGQATVTCEGCTCEKTIIDGHQDARNSLTHLHNFYASQSESCFVVVTVSPDTKSAGHKVKITGIMICEESGRDQEGIRNNGAVEYVADISQAKGGNGTFDVNNHVK